MNQQLEKERLLPLGTILILEGGVKKVMIVARGVATRIEGEVKYFDYGGCLYPEGIVGDQLLYFNEEDSSHIIAKGYHDQDDKLMIENIEKWKEKKGYQKGTPIELNQQNKGE